MEYTPKTSPVGMFDAVALLSCVSVVDSEYPEAAVASICLDVFIGCGCKSMFSLAKIVVSESGPLASELDLVELMPSDESKAIGV